MKTAFRKSFSRDLKKIKDQSLLAGIQRVIAQVDAADNPSSIGDLKKISGSVNSYRIRLGEFRIGIVLEGDTVEFVRCLHRRDLYRFFP